MSTAQPTRRQLVAALGAAPVLVAGARAQERSSRTAAKLAATLVLVRHAEKAPERSADPPLSDVGHARAKSLARTLGHAGVTTLLHSDLKRTRDTVAPMAEALEIEPEAYDARNLSALVERLSKAKADETIVVAGHSNTTPAVAFAFGVELPELDASAAPKGAPFGYLPHDAYDRIHVLTPGKDAARLVELRYDPLDVD